MDNIVSIGNKYYLYNSENNCLLDKVKGNGNCHSYGLINYKTIMPNYSRYNIVPLYVQDICKTKANGCLISYNKCVQKLNYTSNCNRCYVR